MKYPLALDVPKEFYHEIHRPSHYLHWAGADAASLTERKDASSAAAPIPGSGGAAAAAEDDVDREDLFS